MGRFDLSVQDVMGGNPDVTLLNPKWYPLFDWDQKPIEDSGLLVAFQILTAAEASLPKPDIRPETTPMQLEITALGLRNLSSTLGVHKTYVEFELPNGRKFKTHKSRVPSAKNPNYLEMIKVDLPLPVDKLFAPTISLAVSLLLDCDCE